MNIELSTTNLRKLCRICLQRGELNVNEHSVKVSEARQKNFDNCTASDEDATETSNGSKESVELIKNEITVQEIMQVFGKWQCKELQLICASCLSELLPCYRYYAKLVEANKRIQKLYSEALLLENELLEETGVDQEQMLRAGQLQHMEGKIDIQQDDEQCTKTTHANNNQQTLQKYKEVQSATSSTCHEQPQEEYVQAFIVSGLRTPPPSPQKRQVVVRKCKPTKNPKFILTGGVSKILTHVNNDSLSNIAVPTKRACASTAISQKRQRTLRENKTVDILTPLENASLIVTKFIPSAITAEMHLKNENSSQAPATTEKPTVNELRTMDYKAVEIKGTNLQQIIQDHELNATAADTGIEHSAATVYACKYCPQAYASAQYLITHVRKSHVCNFCTQAFVKTPELREHIKQSHRQHICAICGKHLSSHSNLRSHIKRMHGLKLPAQVALLDYRPAVEELVEMTESEEIDEVASQNESVDEQDDMPEDSNYMLCIEYAR